jgi:hypothetical protein
MHYLADQREQAVALVYQNLVLDTYGTTILGVILGNCVFDSQGKARAKYFHHTLYNMEGRILAKENGFVQHLAIDPVALMHASWKVVNHITDHACPVIDPLNEWSSVPVAEHFSGTTI